MLFQNREICVWYTQDQLSFYVLPLNFLYIYKNHVHFMKLKYLLASLKYISNSQLLALNLYLDFINQLFFSSIYLDPQILWHTMYIVYSNIWLRNKFCHPIAICTNMYQYAIIAWIIDLSITIMHEVSTQFTPWICL